jgi:hypothetical protein
MHIFTWYVHTMSFHEKLTYCLGCAKQISTKSKDFYETCFFFLHRTHTKSVFRETERRHMIVELFIRIFLLKLFDN